MDEGSTPPADTQRPPAFLGLILGLAALALLAGLIALILSMGGRLGVNTLEAAQVNQTDYPGPLPTWTIYPGPQGSQTAQPSATGSIAPQTTGSQTVQPSPSGTVYPGPLQSATAEIIPTLNLTIPPAEIFPGDLPPTPLDFFTPTFAPTLAATPTFASVAMPNWCVPWNSQSRLVRVNAVLDGVTIEVTLDGEPVQVRYIGVELPFLVPEPTPQTPFAPVTTAPLQMPLALLTPGATVPTLTPTPPPPLWREALEANRRLVEGKWVTLLKERSDRNQQGQLVRYVLAGGVFVNHELIRQGNVLARSYPPDQSCDDFFKEAEDLAAAQGLGYWAWPLAPTRTLVPTASPQVASADVRVVYVDATGVGWADPNEFVEIRNYASLPVQLGGWKLRDLKGHTFTFPQMLLNAGGYCRIYTNEDHPESCGLSFGSYSAIWDDDDDCARLFDAGEVLVSELCY